MKGYTAQINSDMSDMWAVAAQGQLWERIIYVIKWQRSKRSTCSTTIRLLSNKSVSCWSLESVRRNLQSSEEPLTMVYQLRDVHGYEETLHVSLTAHWLRSKKEPHEEPDSYVFLAVSWFVPVRILVSLIALPMLALSSSYGGLVFGLPLATFVTRGL